MIYNSKQELQTISFGLLPPGTYYWQITNNSGDNLGNLEPLWTFTIRPPPLRHLSVTATNQVGQLTTSPGSTQLKIASVPYARVRLRVTYHGRPYSGVYFTPSIRTADEITYPWKCTATGTFKYAVTASDGYGHTIVARGTWQVSAARCQYLTQLAIRHRASILLAIHRRDAACGAAGGTNAQIGGEYQCLKPGRPCDPYLNWEYKSYGYSCDITGGVVVIIVFADVRRSESRRRATDHALVGRTRIAASSADARRRVGRSRTQSPAESG